jgi:hypothetical protein
MLTLGLAAEKNMDLYYQQYKHQDDFFDLDDFIFSLPLAMPLHFKKISKPITNAVWWKWAKAWAS